MGGTCDKSLLCQCRCLRQHGYLAPANIESQLRAAGYLQRVAEQTEFKPADHRFGPTHWFEDIKVGDKFYVNSRTQTEALFAAFQLASGDNHPIHYDREYCRRHGHPDLLAHGYQVLIQTAAGAGLFPFLVEDSLIGFIEQSSRFLKPVYVGDTLYPQLRVSELKPQRTTGVLALASTVPKAWSSIGTSSVRTGATVTVAAAAARPGPRAGLPDAVGLRSKPSPHAARARHTAQNAASGSQPFRRLRFAKKAMGATLST